MIVNDFLRKYGLERLVEVTKCKVRRDGDLVMLNYDQIKSPMDMELVQACRGIILDSSQDWKIVSWPYNKFFNHGEAHAATVDWSSAVVSEKLDGSMMTMYRHGGKWRVASNGSPTAGGTLAGGRVLTFHDLFWKTYQDAYGQVEVKTQDACFMFELTSPYNRIVVPHEKASLRLHGARNIVTGQELCHMEVAETEGWAVARVFPITCLPDVVASADAVSGMESEGYVVRDAAFNRVKVKGKSYVAMHRLKSSMSMRRLVEIVQMNDADEFLTYFPEYQDAYEKVLVGFQDLCDDTDRLWATHRFLGSQKEFAMEVKHHVASGALFAVRAGRYADVEEWLREWDPKKVLRAIGMEDDDAVGFFV